MSDNGPQFLVSKEKGNVYNYLTCFDRNVDIKVVDRLVYHRAHSILIRGLTYTTTTIPATMTWSQTVDEH